MREKRPYPSFCTKSGRMSDMLGSGKDFSISPSYVMSDDIIDIQDPRYHMRRRTFFEPVRGFAGVWMALRARNPSPSGLATLNSQNTCHGPRSGSKLACGVRAGSLRATEPRTRGKTRGRKRKKCRRAKKHIYILVYILRNMYKVPRRDVLSEIPGVTQVEKGHAGNSSGHSVFMLGRT